MTCWLIEFTDGHKVIIDEKLYEQEKARNFAGRPILYESHWFDYGECRRRNRGVIHASVDLREIYAVEGVKEVFEKYGARFKEVNDDTK